MKIIVGLGNPGIKYKNTRHNTGFMFIDAYKEEKKCGEYKGKFDGEYVKFNQNGEDVILFKPMTFMNLSGNAISQIVSYFKVNTQDVLVVYDDKDLPFCSLRLREKGNPGSHNGMINITQRLGCNDFYRIRVGIGKPQNEMSMVDFVLAKYTTDEIKMLNETFKNIAASIDLFIDGKFNIAMNKYNSGKQQ